jgi:hypothetical protein
MKIFTSKKLNIIIIMFFLVMLSGCSKNIIYNCKGLIIKNEIIKEAKLSFYLTEYPFYSKSEYDGISTLKLAIDENYNPTSKNTLYEWSFVFNIIKNNDKYLFYRDGFAGNFSIKNNTFSTKLDNWGQFTGTCKK